MRFFRKITASVIYGGVFYSIWLVLFLLLRQEIGRAAGVLFFVLMPFVTALGFSIGLGIVKSKEGRLTKTALRSYLFTLTGCGMGAMFFHRYGPLISVAVMFVCGVLAVIVYELVVNSKRMG